MENNSHNHLFNFRDALKPYYVQYKECIITTRKYLLDNNLIDSKTLGKHMTASDISDFLSSMPSENALEFTRLSHQANQLDMMINFITEIYKFKN